MGQKKWIHIFSKRKRELHELYWNSNLTCWFLVPNRLPLLHLHIHYWVLIYLILSFSLLFLFVFFKASIFFILKKKISELLLSTELVPTSILVLAVFWVWAPGKVRLFSWKIFWMKLRALCCRREEKPEVSGIVCFFTP